MAETLLQMVQEVLRKTGQNPSITAFSDNDDTNLIVDYIHEAHLELHSLKVTGIDADGSLTLTTNTRLFTNPVTGLDLYDVWNWSWRITDVPTPLEFVTLEFIERTYPKFESDTAQYPKYVYHDNGQIGIYPFIGAAFSNLTLKFKYPATAAKATQTSSTFLYPDKWLMFMKKHAQMMYESKKGLGNPLLTGMQRDACWGEIAGKVQKNRRVKIKPYRKYP